MIENMNRKLVFVVGLFLVEVGWVNSDCVGGVLKCFGEAIGNLTKMYEDTNNDVNFNFKIDISTMNASDIRNLLLSSNNTLNDKGIDFVDGDTLSRTTIIQLADVLRDELKKNDVDLTESKLFMKINNFSIIEVQIFDLIDEDESGEETDEMKIDNSTFTLNVNVVMKNSTIKLMDDKGDKLATSEDEDYEYADLQERQTYGTNKKIKIIKDDHEEINKNEKDKSMTSDQLNNKNAIIKTKQKEHEDWNKDETEKLIEFDNKHENKNDSVKIAKAKDYEKWINSEKEKLLEFEKTEPKTANQSKISSEEHDNWSKKEKEQLIKFDEKSKENENKNITKIEILNSTLKIDNLQDNKNNTLEKKEELKNLNKNETINLMEWNYKTEEKKTAGLINNHQSESLISNDFDQNTDSKQNAAQELQKVMKKYYRSEQIQTTTGFVVKETSSSKDMSQNQNQNQGNYKNIKNMQKNIKENEKYIVYDKIKENENRPDIKLMFINSLKNKIIERNIKNKVPKEVQKEVQSPKEVVEEHEEWNKKIREKLKEMKEQEEEDVDMVTENAEILELYPVKITKSESKGFAQIKNMETEITTKTNDEKQPRIDVSKIKKDLDTQSARDIANSKAAQEELEEYNRNRLKQLERKIQEQKETIEKIKKQQKIKENEIIKKYSKLTLDQLEEESSTTTTKAPSNDIEKAREIEEELLRKAQLNKEKAKMVYHVVTEMTYVTSQDNLKSNEKEDDEDSNPIDGFYYDLKDDNKTGDYLNIDYLDLFKDTTNEDIPYTTLPPYLFVTHSFRDAQLEAHKKDETDKEMKVLLDVARDSIGQSGPMLTPVEQHYSCNTNITKRDLADVVFPWIAAVFVRNGSSNAFEYVCDGAIVSDKFVVTAAHCLASDGPKSVKELKDVIIILGKKNQREMTSNQFYKVTEVKLNAYYSSMDDHISHDLVILKLDKQLEFNERVIPACLLDFDLGDEDTILDAITTGWDDDGKLTAIHFETYRKVQNNTFCLKDYVYQHVFCDTIGFEVQICPSYGGIYAVKLSNHHWYLKGILSADTTKKGLCIERNLRFTSLVESEHRNWLKTVIKT